MYYLKCFVPSNNKPHGLIKKRIDIDPSDIQFVLDEIVEPKCQALIWSKKAKPSFEAITGKPQSVRICTTGYNDVFLLRAEESMRLFADLFKRKDMVRVIACGSNEKQYIGFINTQCFKAVISSPYTYLLFDIRKARAGGSGVDISTAKVYVESADCPFYRRMHDKCRSSSLNYDQFKNVL